jgi:hypothetical protein
MTVLLFPDSIEAHLTSWSANRVSSEPTVDQEDVDLSPIVKIIRCLSSPSKLASFMKQQNQGGHTRMGAVKLRGGLLHDEWIQAATYSQLDGMNRLEHNIIYSLR